MSQSASKVTHHNPLYFANVMSGNYLFYSSKVIDFFNVFSLACVWKNNFETQWKGKWISFFLKSRRVVKKKKELIKGTDWLEVGPHLFLLLVLYLSLLFDVFHNHIHTYPACNVIFGLTCSGLVLTRYFCWFIFFLRFAKFYEFAREVPQCARVCLC